MLKLIFGAVSFSRVYCDGVVILSTTFEGHKEHKKSIELESSDGFILNLISCEFAKEELAL